MKILFKLSSKLEKGYVKSLNKVLKSITQNKKLSDIEFQIEIYDFTRDEIKQIKSRRSEFIYSKFDLGFPKEVNSIIYIPDSSTNIKGNYLWYAFGEPKELLMVVSSLLFRTLFEGKLEFGAYVLVLYSQVLTRWAVELDEPHRESRNCLNDHCSFQLDLLNVFENEKKILCDECIKNLIDKNKKYYTLAKDIINIVRKLYDLRKEEPKKIVPKKKESKKEIPKEIKITCEFKEDKGNWYEFEIYLGKKCTNVYNLYKKLEEILLDSKSEIIGFSIYEVGGGWRGDINLNKAEKDDWDKLYKLQKKFGKDDFKDVIKPLIDENGKRYAIFDETSIILRIIADTKKEIENLDPKRFMILGEILDICQDIAKIEKSIYFTMKKLEKKGSIVEIQD